MIDSLQLINNTGTFDNVIANAFQFKPTTIIYAENGKGKTTLSSIFRSLLLNEPDLINERKRLGATGNPHIVINDSSGTQYVFQNGTWSSNNADIAVFDDNFVSENICSGILLDVNHRQNLHELIIGSQGVQLNRVLQNEIQNVNQHNQKLREIGVTFTNQLIGNLTIDEFCRLEKITDIEQKITYAERKIKAFNESEPIKNTQIFLPIALPQIELSDLNEILSFELESLELNAVERVKKHFEKVGQGSEAWIRTGVNLLARNEDEICPFCTQSTSGLDIIEHYQAYFGEEYSNLQQRIRTFISAFRNDHRQELFSAFERNVRITIEKIQFWSKFTEIPEFNPDSALISSKWKESVDDIFKLLEKKSNSPLEKITIDSDLKSLIENYITLKAQFQKEVDELIKVNEQIEIIKEQVKSDDSTSIQADLNNLIRNQRRFSSEIDAKCTEYLQELGNKTITEGRRDQARQNLDNYRTSIFPAYENDINTYLSRFNAGFRLQGINPSNRGGRPSCNYSVVINNHDVSITSSSQGEPSFRSTLSAGDRNTLALAFFFATLKNDTQLGQKIVLIDDPMTSLDDHRSLATRQEIRNLSNQVLQVILLSHSKSFLGNYWLNTASSRRSDIAPLKIVRGASGSVIDNWDVNQDCISEHDKRHEKVVSYLENSTNQNEREVAESLRPILEYYLRAAYPDHFTPESMLGSFINKCQSKIGGADEIMDNTNISELRSLKDYGNKFHHDTNPAWQTEVINGTELTGYAQRTLDFIKK